MVTFLVNRVKVIYYFSRFEQGELQIYLTWCAKSLSFHFAVTAFQIIRVKGLVNAALSVTIVGSVWSPRDKKKVRVMHQHVTFTT